MGQKIRNGEEIVLKVLAPKTPAAYTGYNALREKNLREEFALRNDL